MELNKDTAEIMSEGIKIYEENLQEGNWYVIRTGINKRYIRADKIEYGVYVVKIIGDGFIINENGKLTHPYFTKKSEALSYPYAKDNFENMIVKKISKEEAMEVFNKKVNEIQEKLFE